MQSKPVLKMFTRQLTMKRTKKAFNHCKKKSRRGKSKLVGTRNQPLRAT